MADTHWFDALSKTLRRNVPRRTALQAASGFFAGLGLGSEIVTGAAKNGSRGKKAKNGNGNGPKRRKKEKKGKDRPDDREQPVPPPEEPDLCDGRCGNHLECCDGQCVYLPTDPDHCGECGRFCQGASYCVDNHCECDDGWPNSRRKECPGLGCVDTHVDSQNCGRCGNVCSPWEVCRDGDCACPNGLTKCGDECVDTETDPEHCRACGNACPPGYDCGDSQCVCNDPLCGGCRSNSDCPQGKICLTANNQYLCNATTDRNCQCDCGTGYRYCWNRLSGRYVCFSGDCSLLA
jgi:hypothetical protein